MSEQTLTGFDAREDSFRKMVRRVVNALPAPKKEAEEVPPKPASPSGSSA